MSRLRPHTVKASLSNDEKKAITAIAKRHEMSEAELIRFVLCNADDLDIDFGFSEIADQKFRTDDIHVRVSPEEKKIIGSVEKVGVASDPKRVGPASRNLEYG